MEEIEGRLFAINEALNKNFKPPEEALDLLIERFGIYDGQWSTRFEQYITVGCIVQIYCAIEKNSPLKMQWRHWNFIRKTQKNDDLKDILGDYMKECQTSSLFQRNLAAIAARVSRLKEIPYRVHAALYLP